MLTQDIFGRSTDEDGDSGVHGTDSGGAHGMHGDGVGIGDIVDVQGGTGGAGGEAGGGDSMSVIGERDTDVISTVLFIGACPVLLTVTLTCRYMAQVVPTMITPMTGRRHHQNLQLLTQKQQRRGSKMRDRDNEYYLYG